MGRPSNNYSPRELKEGRVFQCIMYDGDTPEQHEELVCRLNRLSSFWQFFYYIRHDSDTWSEYDNDKFLLDNPMEKPPYNIGDLKKPHYHCIGVSSPCVLGRAAIKFDVPSNLVQHVKSKKSAIRYLIHLDNPEKHQYLPDEIISNDPDLQSYLKNEMDCTMKAKILIEFIDSIPGNVTLSSVTSFALQNNCWDELRRGQHLFTALIFEHNQSFRSVSNEN